MPFTNLFDEFGNYRKRVIVQDVEIQVCHVNSLL
jgi:hypothetical protein